MFDAVLIYLPNLAFPCYNDLYLFHAGRAERHTLEKSMKWLQQHTCIKFIEIQPPYEVYSHYVHFISTINNR